MGKASSVKTLNVNNSAELLSYIINQDPVLSENIDLPVQGQSIAPIGRIIMNNQRYKNAFLNVVNVIGMTVITRNHWENPWEDFTNKGDLGYGQQIREVVCDIANVYDYNLNQSNVTRFLENVVPNVMEYIHEVNFQKFYQTTTSDVQMSMAFENDDLFSLIDEIINSLYEGLMYDKFLVNKYMVCRRILDGTFTPVYINTGSLSVREQVAVMKGVSNKLSFRSPNYNPAGLKKASSFDEQMTILDADFEGKLTTEVLATSYFRDDADLKTRLALVDSWSATDTDRLNELFSYIDTTSGDRVYINGYTPFTEDEITALAKILGVIVGKDFFQNYKYRMAIEGEGDGRKTEFFNPTTLKTNHFLSFWGVFSTSPFENAVVLTNEQANVTGVTVSPSTLSISAGTTAQFSATVATAGFANKAVTWSVDSTSVGKGVTIDNNGKLTIPSSVTDLESITVTATSVFKTSVYGTATVTLLYPAAAGTNVSDGNR